jgi:hypothetical protein
MAQFFKMMRDAGAGVSKIETRRTDEGSRFGHAQIVLGHAYLGSGEGRGTGLLLRRPTSQMSVAE